ncbi:MAG TPA: class I SAM-dependent methyltransferase [Candidatus Limnocylindrales bacterium]|nr:class I SAM-dependent methyltransferase [Candidatus Limnocylindrales bacterium]
MLAPVSEPLIRALQLDAPYRIADIGCGGGGTTLEILRQAPEGSLVHGFDISPALIDVARARTRPDQRAIAFELADMATAPAPTPLYDRLVSRFGVMFFDHPAAAFANLARWLAPGGRFAFAVWGRVPDNPWITSVRDVAAEFIEIPPTDPTAPGPFRFAKADQLIALLERAGLGELDVRDWRGALRIGGGLPAAEAASFVLAAFSSFGDLLASAGDSVVHAARQSLVARFAGYQRDGAVQLDAAVHIVTGARLPSHGEPPRAI